MKANVRVSTPPSSYNDNIAFAPVVASSHPDAHIHKLSEAMLTQQSAVLRLEEKVRDAEAVIHTLRSSASLPTLSVGPAIQSSGAVGGSNGSGSGRVIINVGGESDLVLSEDEDNATGTATGTGAGLFPIKRSSSAGLLDIPSSRHRHGQQPQQQQRSSSRSKEDTKSQQFALNTLSPLLKTILKQFDGLAKENSPDNTVTAAYSIQPSRVVSCIVSYLTDACNLYFYSATYLKNVYIVLFDCMDCCMYIYIVGQNC